MSLQSKRFIKMKQQYSSNYDDPFVANERLKNKLDFLEREAIKRESYVKEIERNLKVTKQTIKTLNNNNNHPKDDLILQLQNENSLLFDKLSQEYNSVCKLNTLYLMECQLRLEESKSFNERIKDFEETMAQLRRYLHDKEESFSFVAEKLKKYEQLLPNQQLTMYQKLVNYSGIAKEDVTWKSVISEILLDRDQWKKNYDCEKQKNTKMELLVEGLREHAQFSKFQNLVNNLGEQELKNISQNITNTSGFNSLSSIRHQQGKNNSSQSTKIYSDSNKLLSVEPNIELIRLMKKEKLNNKILEVALAEAIQKNLQLIEYNKKLIDSNDNLRDEVDLIIADMVVVCSALSQYDHNYKTKLRILKHRSKCDIDLPSYKEIITKYKANNLQQSEQILFTKNRKDIEELTEYINLCPLQKTNSIRSYESPRKMYAEYDDMEISMNGQELEISEI